MLISRLKRGWNLREMSSNVVNATDTTNKEPTMFKQQTQLTVESTPPATPTPKARKYTRKSSYWTNPEERSMKMRLGKMSKKTTAKTKSTKSTNTPYRIEKGVPFPTKAKANKHNCQYPLMSMKVMDSFTTARSEETNLRNTVSRIEKLSNIKFKVKRVIENGHKLMRCWRIRKPQTKK